MVLLESILINLVILVSSFTLFSSSSPNTLSIQYDSYNNVNNLVIPSNFLGFSYEWNEIISAFGLYQGSDSNSPYFHFSHINLIQTYFSSKNPDGSLLGPNIRMGGISTDSTIFDDSTITTSLLQQYQSYLPNYADAYNYQVHNLPFWNSLNFITTPMLQTLRATIQKINSNFIIGLNFRRPNNITWTSTILQQVQSLIGLQYINSFEIGNEPDLYGELAFRFSNYTVLQYQNEWISYTNQILTELNNNDSPMKIFQGATFSGSVNSFLFNISSLNNIANNKLKSISLHYYPITNTNTMDDLLSIGSVTNLMNFIETNLAYVNQDNVEFLLGEGNSCAGGECLYTVSNRFGSALWAIDMFFSVASTGAIHYYVHGSESLQGFGPLVYQNEAIDQISVMPIFYGMYFFNVATANSVKILPSTLNLNIGLPYSDSIRSWTVIDNQSNIRIILLHKGFIGSTALLTTSINLAISLTSTSITNNNNCYNSQARLSQLLSPNNNITATLGDGITFEGKTWDNNINGLLQGILNQPLININQNDGTISFNITLEVSTATIVHLDYNSAGCTNNENNTNTATRSDNHRINIIIIISIFLLNFLRLLY